MLKYIVRHRSYVNFDGAPALGITILTWVSSANVKAKLEILLGIGWIKEFRKKCVVLGCRVSPL